MAIKKKRSSKKSKAGSRGKVARAKAPMVKAKKRPAKSRVGKVAAKKGGGKVARKRSLKPRIFGRKY